MTYSKHPCVYPFLHNDKCELWFIIGLVFLAGGYQLRHFILFTHFQLSITDAIAIKYLYFLFV